METSKSILTRRVISVGDRKQVGEIRDFRIDSASGAIEYFIISDSNLNKFFLLPFTRILTIGDAFVAIQKDSSLIPIEPSNQSATKKVEQGERLVGLEAVSSSGDRLGAVEDFDFDPRTGKIASVRLNSGETFAAAQIAFFAETFIFINKEAAPAAAPATPAWDIDKFIAAEQVPDPLEAPAVPTPAVVPAYGVPTPAVAPEAAAAPEIPAMPDLLEGFGEAGEPEPSADNSLRKFLLGATLSDDVTSEDGAFTAHAGEMITESMLDDAEAHDALLLMTISVKE